MKDTRRIKLILAGTALALAIGAGSLGVAFATDAGPPLPETGASQPSLEPTTLVTTYKANVRVGVLPEGDVAAMDSYIANQAATLAEYSKTAPDMEVCAFITFKEGVDQEAIDQILAAQRV